MNFNLSGWWMRRKFGAQVRSGGYVEHRRVANPYHAVTIEAGPGCCMEAAAQAGRRHLSTVAPMLPLKGCTRANCQCRYVHHEDRRASVRDRRINFANPRAHKMTDRRAGGGRRIND